MNDPERKMQERIAKMRERLKDVPPEQQRANLFSALWRESEDDCAVLTEQVLRLRATMEPMLAVNLDTLNLTTLRELLAILRKAYDDSEFVVEWQKQVDS